MAYTGERNGVITSANAVSTNQMPDQDVLLYELEPYQTPIYQFIYFSEGRQKVCINENGKFDWHEDELYPHQDTLSGNITGGASSEDNISLTNADMWNTGDIMLIEETEQMVYVDSIASSQVDITHIDGSTNITAATSGGYVRKVGTRVHEFDTARTAVSTKEVQKSNYCQIFSETVTTSGRRQAGDKYTNGKSHKDELMKKIKEMKFMYERAWIYNTGSGTVTVSSAYRFTYGEGMLGRFTTNSTPYLGVSSEDSFLDYMKDITAKGSNHRTHYAGSGQYSEILKWVRDYYRVDNMDTEFGYDLQRIKLGGFGIVDLVWDPVLEGKFTNYGFTLDTGNEYTGKVQLRYMANDEKGSRKFRIEEDVETPGTDGKSDKLLSDIGIQIPNEEVNGIYYRG